MFMDAILEFKREEVRRVFGSPNSQVERARAARPTRNFVEAICRDSITAIAEIKPKSPSRGSFAQAANPIGLALQYQQNGAAALSVLADRRFFGGGPELVERVANDPSIFLPVLYKDFVVDEQQIYAARACGADAVLLIARAIAKELLREFVGLTHELGMEALVETFDEGDIVAALTSGARVIGINNRDLQTFAVNLDRATQLVSLIPQGIVKISESGISSRSDVIRVDRLGFDSMLIGEELLISSNPGLRLAQLLTWEDN